MTQAGLTTNPSWISNDVADETAHQLFLTVVVSRPNNRSLASTYRRRGTVAAVADDLGVSFETARQWLLAAGVELRAPGRPCLDPGKVQVDEIIKRYRQGESFATIAASLNVSPNTIRNRLIEAGIPLRSRYGWKY